MSYHALVLASWEKLVDIVTNSHNVTVDGASLDIASVVASARYGSGVELSHVCGPRVEQSRKYLNDRLEAGDTIYGELQKTS